MILSQSTVGEEILVMFIQVFATSSFCLEFAITLHCFKFTQANLPRCIMESTTEPDWLLVNVMSNASAHLKDGVWQQ